jgi:hypothetical protein
MLLARAARRRAQQETLVADVARDFGAPGTTPLTAGKTSIDETGLGQIQPASERESWALREAHSFDGRGSDGLNDENSFERISINEVLRLQQSGDPVVMLDVRTERSLETSDLQVQGAIRLLPEDVVRRASELNLRKDAWLIAYCA